MKLIFDSFEECCDFVSQNSPNYGRLSREHAQVLAADLKELADRSQYKIKAIRVFRTATGAGLAASKYAVETGRLSPDF